MDGNEMTLLPLERKHLEYLRGLRHDPRMNGHVFSPSIPFTARQQELWYEGLLADKSSLVFIAQAPGLPWVGYGQLKNIDHANHSVELGTHIEPDWQGEGWGTALVKKLVDLATGPLGMHRVWLEVFASNRKAIHVYEKCGFVREGIQRDKILKDGRFRDVLTMSRLGEV